MEKLKYRVKKIKFLVVIIIQQLALRIFYFFNKNNELNIAIEKNREYLKTIDLFLPEEAYIRNDYGVQRRIYEKLEKICDSIIDKIISNQEDDGYLNYFFTRHEPENKFTNLFLWNDLNKR